MSLREKNKQQARTSILEASAQLIGELGVEGTTTRQIAESAGVSYQTLYNYFPSKALILQELLRGEFEIWSAEVDQFIKLYDGDLYATLNHIHRRGVEIFLGEHHELWTALASSMLNLRNEPELGHDILITVPHERYHALLSLAQGYGDLDANIDLHLLAHTLYSLSDYAMLMVFMQPTSADNVINTLSQQMRLVLAPYLNSQIRPAVD